jgi:hypothetical protein
MNARRRQNRDPIKSIREFWMTVRALRAGENRERVEVTGQPIDGAATGTAVGFGAELPKPGQALHRRPLLWSELLEREPRLIELLQRDP